MTSTTFLSGQEVQGQWLARIYTIPSLSLTKAKSAALRADKSSEITNSCDLNRMATCSASVSQCRRQKLVNSQGGRPPGKAAVDPRRAFHKRHTAMPKSNNASPRVWRSSTLPAAFLYGPTELQVSRTVLEKLWTSSTRRRCVPVRQAHNLSPREMSKWRGWGSMNNFAEWPACNNSCTRFI